MVTNIQPAAHREGVVDFPPEVTCSTESGLNYVQGQSWLRNQGDKEMLCNCVGNGISCQEWGESCRLATGKSPSVYSVIMGYIFASKCLGRIIILPVAVH